MIDFADLLKTPVTLTTPRPWWAFWRRRIHRGTWIVESVTNDRGEVRVGLLDLPSAIDRYKARG